MDKDLVYFCENIQTDNLTLLGEMQHGKSGFNMSFVIDGTKDSSKLQVVSYSRSEVVKPNSVIYHTATNSWWIVANDKVERYINENDFVYVHTLQLEGAVELLNARDLTDCGFNQDTYTIDSFVRRLFKLSNFELEDIVLDFGNNLDGTKEIDYIKTYENYTLLSALRDIFSGYNCSIKLSFATNESDKITTAILKVIPKTGNIDREIDKIDEVFNGVQEIKTMNKNSYGTTVISNAENVVSTITKTYPSVGAVRVSGTAHTIDGTNAVIRLPSKVFKVNRVDMIPNVAIQVIIYGESPETNPTQLTIDNIFPEDNDSLLLGLRRAIDFAYEYTRGSTYDEIRHYLTDFEDRVNNDFDNVREEVLSNAKVSLYDDIRYNPVDDTFSSGHPITQFSFRSSSTPTIVSYKPYVLTDSETRACLLYPYQAMYYERGSNLIKGFEMFREWALNSTLVSNKSAFALVDSGFTYLRRRIYIRVTSIDQNRTTDTLTFFFNDTRYVVEYIPMTDIKVKLDNVSTGHNIQLYNQNGKLTDCNALSKLINSYKTEIESDNITRYISGYYFEKLPKVGDILIDYDYNQYVINNVSLDFHMNEESTDYGYYIVGEYTLSRNVATKSLMTSPNTNIRDYGIPQKYNVSRKQLYRDFYELAHEFDPLREDNEYMKLKEVINISNYSKEIANHTAVMKVTFDKLDDKGKQNYYYQLNTTSYCFKKSYFEIVEFDDNNIIGYGSQNRETGFLISLIYGSNSMINTPISYVDDNGRFQDISLAFCTNEQITTIWKDYKDTKGYSGSISIYNYSVFIPEEIYEGYDDGQSVYFDGAKDNSDFVINDIGYEKDALEVPVFEYSCQIDDTNDCIVGENVLDSDKDGAIYFYSYALVEKNKYNENNCYSLRERVKAETNFSGQDVAFIDNSVYFDPRVATLLNINLTKGQYYNLETKVFEHQDIKTFENEYRQYDLAVFRHKLSSDTEIEEIEGIRYLKTKDTLMFIVKNMENAHIVDDTLELCINHYRLK